MASTNKIPQFDKSKTNLTENGSVNNEGFKANTLISSGEVNQAFYNCSLAITGLLKAIAKNTKNNNTYNNSDSVDELANKLTSDIEDWILNGIDGYALVDKQNVGGKDTASGNIYNIYKEGNNFYQGSTGFQKIGTEYTFYNTNGGSALTFDTYGTLTTDTFNSNNLQSSNDFVHFLKANKNGNIENGFSWSKVGIQNNEHPYQIKLPDGIWASGGFWAVFKTRYFIYGSEKELTFAFPPIWLTRDAFMHDNPIALSNDCSVSLTNGSSMLLSLTLENINGSDYLYIDINYQTGNDNWDKLTYNDLTSTYKINLYYLN